jgi:PAS domain S-box-containing protein
MSEPAEAANVEVLHAAVEAFRKRDLGFRDLLEDLPAAIYTTDVDGRITYFNRACVDFAGRTPVLGEDRWCVTWKLYAPDGQPLPHDKSPMALALMNLEGMHGVEAIAEKPDGHRINLAAFPTPIFDRSGECAGAVNMLIDVTEQRQAQERLSLLAREIDHRSNNLLTLVQSLVRLTRAQSIDAYRDELEGRIAALARANALIAEARWNDIDLATLVAEEFGAFGRERFETAGPAIKLSPASAQSLGMVIHELCTNAVKHGALSVIQGKVQLTWAIDDTQGFMLIWNESGGPPTTEPRRKNTGNAVILGAVRQLKAEIFREWRPEGLRCTLQCGLSRL